MASRWKNMTDEQKQNHRDGERKRRAHRRAVRSDEQKQLLSIQRKEARKRRKDRNIEHHRSVNQRYHQYGKGYFYGWANCIRRRAKVKGLPYDLDADFLMSIMPERCPVLDIPLARRTGVGTTANSPTVDRIVPELGYVRGNVMIISKRANQIKSDASPEEIMKVAQFYTTLLNQ